MADINHSRVHPLMDDASLRGVLRQSLCEATGGFAAGRFPSEQRESACLLLERFDSTSARLTRADILLLEKCVAFTMMELGNDEFQTITGYEYSKGTEALDLLKKASLE